MKRTTALFLVGLLAIFLTESYGETAAKPSPTNATQMAVNPPASENRKLVVYYFHGNARCMTCRKFETLTKDVIETRFAQEVKNGRLEYRAVNVDEADNGHFVNDYGLYSKSVLLSDTKDGQQTRWKNLDKIWKMVRVESAYRQYIEDEVRAYLKGA